MGISELYIVKRDGKREAFFDREDPNAPYAKAFLSVGSYATDDDAHVRYLSTRTRRPTA